MSDVPLPKEAFGAKSAPKQPVTGRLLLAPLDTDAEAALFQTLTVHRVPFEPNGKFFALPVGADELAERRETLSRLLSPALQESIKAVYCDQAVTEPDGLLSAFLEAERLPVFFEQADAAWVRQVLDGQPLFSAFQPIVNAQDGEVFGYECMIRAYHPETQEVISAGQLLYACQRMNLLHELDQRARLTAIREASALPKSDIRFFVNFLPGAIYDPEICLRATMQAVSRSPLSMENLVFEVVETERIPDMARLRAILTYCREQGAKIALDDISQGFSPIQSLIDLAPDYIKIDRQLVSAAESLASARQTLEATVALAKRLGIAVIAEGIENTAQMRLCREAGVDYLQGFLFAHPANPPEAVRPMASVLKKAA